MNLYALHLISTDFKEQTLTRLLAVIVADKRAALFKPNVGKRITAESDSAIRGMQTVKYAVTNYSLTESEGMLSDCNNRVLSIKGLEQVGAPPHVPPMSHWFSTLPHNKWIRADYVSYCLTVMLPK